MNKYNKLPLKKLGITGTWQDHTSRGSRGIDFGWFDYQGEDVYAMNDGVVDQIDYSTGTGNAGWYVWIKHEYTSTNDIWSRYCHLKEGSIVVKVGQKVTRGQKIAQMGGTFGYATHLHLETWVVPKGWKFNWGDRTKYSLPATDYAYAFPDQYIGNGADNVAIQKVVGNPVSRDKSKNQIEVVGMFLRCRNGAGTSAGILGFIDLGIYDYSETKDANGYTWYHIPAGWIAGTKEDTKVYPKENPTPTPTPDPDDKDKKIKELEAQVASLQETVKKQDAELLAQKKLIEEQKAKIDELVEELEEHGLYAEYEAKKDYIYVKLAKGDKVYRKIE